jgi:hypothetical protein
VSGSEVAANWLISLVDRGDVGEVRTALEAKPVTNADAWRTLAAAEVVAAAAGQPAQGAPAGLVEWVERNAAEAGALSDLARETVARTTRYGSPLHDLWADDDQDDHAAWTMRLADLERRLGVR